MTGAGVALRALACGLALGCGAGAMAPAQGFSEGTLQTPFVTLDEQRLFAGSQYGQALIAELDAALGALAAENRIIEADLAGRERDLTERRPALDPVAFRDLADAFNSEVDAHRRTQQDKERAIYQRHEQDRLRFRDVANQVLALLMAERGALAVLDEQAILLGFREIDITDDAIARLDALLGDGSGLPRPGSVEVAPEGDGEAPPPGD